MKGIRLALAAVALLGLSGCFDLLEEIWINPDGTARMVVDVALPKALLHLAGQDPLTELRQEAKATEAELKQDPAVTRFEFRDFEKDGQHHLVYDLEVSDATRLADLHQRAMARAAQNGKNDVQVAFTLERSSGGDLRFVQRLGGAAELADGGLDEQDSSFARDVMGAMFAGHFFTVRVHAPKVGESNGTVDEKRETVEWKVPVGDLAGGAARELKAELHTGAPLWMWAVVLGVPGLLLVLAVGAMKKKRA